MFPGSSSKITEQNLRGTDMDSDNLKLSYVLTQDPSAGRLLLGRSGHQEPISTSRTLRSFTQQDVNKGSPGSPPHALSGAWIKSNLICRGLFTRVSKGFTYIHRTATKPT